MLQYIYMSAQEEDDVGISGLLMGGGNNYSSGLFQLLPGVFWERKLSFLSRVPTHVWQVIVVSDNDHGFNKAIDLAYGECVVLL